MKKTVYLEILTPEKKIFAGDAKLVGIPGSSGAFSILKKHAAIISTMDEGKVKVIKPDGAIEFFNVKGGFIECLNDKIIILAE